MKDHQRCTQDSGNVELYTDPKITAMARLVMGGIELDPASCEFANSKFVQAERFYTKEDDGLNKIWKAKTVWMNHPFGKPEQPCKPNCNKKTCQPYDKETNPKGRGHHIDKYIPGNIDWHRKLLLEVEYGNVQQATGICFAELSSDWGQIITKNAIICIPFNRISYFDKNGVRQGSAPKGSVIYYYGPNEERFKMIFSQIGTVMKAVI